MARLTKLSRRPYARCAIVQINSIGACKTCSDTHKTATCCSANTSKNKPHASTTLRQHTTTPTATLQQQQRKTRNTSFTPREDCHVPNRCGCKLTARLTKLGRRPCARCTVVQINSIVNSTICNESMTVMRRQPPAAQTQAKTSHTPQPHFTNTQQPQQQHFNTQRKTRKFKYLQNLPRTWPRSQQMWLQVDGAPH